MLFLAGFMGMMVVGSLVMIGTSDGDGDDVATDADMDGLSPSDVEPDSGGGNGLDASPVASLFETLGLRGSFNDAGVRDDGPPQEDEPDLDDEYDMDDEDQSDPDLNGDGATDLSEPDIGLSEAPDSAPALADAEDAYAPPTPVIAPEPGVTVDGEYPDFEAYDPGHPGETAAAEGVYQPFEPDAPDDAMADPLQGSDRDDSLNGDTGNNEILGGAGADSLDGFGGADIVNGGAGDDQLSGGSGDDLLLGGSGHDALHGRDGADRLVGGVGEDTLFGDSGDDVLSGVQRDESGADRDDMDFLSGGDGADRLEIGSGDIAMGGAGIDSFVLGDWISGDDPAELLDFDRVEDRLVIIFDDSSDAVEPEVLLRPSAAIPGQTDVLVDGIVISVMPTEDAPELDDVVVLGQSAATALIAA